jgi:hypothetical protein
MHKKIFQLVMGLAQKIISKNERTQVQDPNVLTVPELEFLLNTLRGTTIKGEQVEMFYNLVVKIQNQYINQSQK